MFSIVDCCARCGICPEQLLACSRCKVTRYCSKECQAISWKGGHKQLCEKLALPSEQDFNHATQNEHCTIDPFDFAAFEQLYFATLMGCKKSWRVLLSYASPLGSSPHSSPYACALAALCFLDASTNFIRLSEIQIKKYGDMCIRWLKEEAEKPDPNPVACFLYYFFVTEISICDDGLPKGALDEKLYDHIANLNYTSMKAGVAEAFFRVGMSYYSPRRADLCDYVSAASMLTKAADKGHPRAIDNLALLHEQGQGVATDGRKALELYQSMADKGCPRSKCIIARYYEMGIGVEEDLNEAVRRYSKEAEAGNMFCQFELAMCYQQGKGVEENLELAVEWLQRSSYQGFEKSMKFLSECYLFGKGTPVNRAKARKWMAAAAVRGCGTSRERLSLGNIMIGPEMTWAEIKELADTVL